MHAETARPTMKLLAAALEGQVIRLEPLGAPLRAEMQAALDVDPASWALQYADARGQAFDPYWSTMMRQVEAGDRIAFGARLADGRLVGTSSFLNISVADRTVEIGSTFFRPEVRGTAVNPEAKLLMMGHAFDGGALRVQFTVDSRNARSQAAVAKLGAVREGVLRRHLITWTAHRRDSVVFSVIDSDWPQVRQRLTERLQACAGPAGPA